MRIFIISWAGQHENASAIAKSLALVRDSVAIVYSDPDPLVEPQADCKKIRRPNDLFWADKFSACLQSAGAEPLLVLHADCMCDDWLGLASKCQEAFSSIKALGVWAPVIRGCALEIECTRIANLNKTTLSLAAYTDAICFAISAPVAARMRRANYAKNKFGWGIAWMMTARAHSRNALVVVDESIEVRHPLERGYPSGEALAQMKTFLKQLSVQEIVQYKVLERFVMSQLRRLKAAK